MACITQIKYGRASHIQTWEMETGVSEGQVYLGLCVGLKTVWDIGDLGEGRGGEGGMEESSQPVLQSQP